MKKIILILIFFSFFIYDGCDSVEPHTDFDRIDFVLTGGIMGLNDKTSVYEGGSATFSQYSARKEFIISTQLTDKQFADLSSILNENHIFRFADSYRLPQPVMDNFNYIIMYKSSRGTKEIFAEEGADIPEELNNIIRMMLEISNIIQNNPEYGSLIPVWDNESTIRKWPFSQVQLHVKAFYYDSLGISNDIMDYFDEIKRNSGYNIFYWDRDSLYEIYDARDQGYFNVHKGYPAKLWSAEFALDPDEFKANGLVKPVDEWNRLGFTFQRTYVFVTDSLADNGKAIIVTLIPGKIKGETNGLISEN